MHPFGGLFIGYLDKKECWRARLAELPDIVVQPHKKLLDSACFYEAKMVFVEEPGLLHGEPKYTVGAHRLGSEQGAPKALIVEDHTGLTLAHVDVNPGETAGAVTARLVELTGKSAGVTVHGYLRAMTSEEVLASWEHTRSVASAEGTEAHYRMELLLNNDPHRAKDPEVVHGRKFLETVIAGLGATIHRISPGRWTRSCANRTGSW